MHLDRSTPSVPTHAPVSRVKPHAVDLSVVLANRDLMLGRIHQFVALAKVVAIASSSWL